MIFLFLGLLQGIWILSLNQEIYEFSISFYNDLT